MKIPSRKILPFVYCVAFTLFHLTAAAEESAIGLVEALRIALDQNPDRQAQLAAVEAKEQEQRAARGSLFPQLSLGANYSDGHESIRGDFYGLSNVDSSDSFVKALVGVRLSQTIYEPQRWADLDLAKLRTERARLQLQRFDSSLLLELADAYFGVLAAKDTVKLREAEVEHVQTQLDQIRERAAAGLELETDALSAEARLANTRAQLIEERYALEAAYARLDAVTSEHFRQLRVLPPEMSITPPDPPDPDAWVRQARQRNFDVRMAELATHIAKRENKRQRDSRLPSISLTGTAGYLDENGGLAGDRTEEETRIGLNFSMPLFSSGTTTAKIAATQATLQETQASLMAARARAEKEIRVNFATLAGARARVPAIMLARDAAKSAEDAASSAYDAGTRTSADLLAAIQVRYDAERALSAARYDYMLSSLRLHASAGQLSLDELAPFDEILQPALAR